MARLQLAKSEKISHESLLVKILASINKGINSLDRIVSNPDAEAKDVTSAVNCLVSSYTKIADAMAVEKLPLLEELEKQIERKSA
jgi:hypothetical protein